MAVINTPKLPPLIVVKTRDYHYVYTYKNLWDAEKKRSYRSDSHKVGSIDVKTGKVTFSTDFIDEHEELKLIDVFRVEGDGKKRGSWEFRPKGEFEDELYLERVRNVRKIHGGATWTLMKLAQECGIGKILSELFPSRYMAQKLLSLIFYLVIHRDNALYNYTTFAETTWLPFKRPLTSPQISRLLSSISHDDVERYFKKMDKVMSLKNKDNYEPRCLALDSTSISVTGKGLSYTGWGHNKDGDELPQINVLMVVDQKSGMPLYYRTYEGSVPDVKTVAQTISERCRLGLNPDVVFVSDRGYISAENIDICLRQKMHFLFNCRIGSMKAVRDLIDDHYDEFLSPDVYNTFLDRYCMSDELEWRYAEYPVKAKRQVKDAKEKLFYHIYFDEQIATSIAMELKRNVSLVLTKLRDDIPLEEVEESIKDDFLEYDEETKSWKSNTFKINERIKYKGFRVLVSDQMKDSVEAFKAYDARNMVEYAFNTLKYRLNCSRTRCHSDRALTGKIFIQVIASSLAIMLRRKLAEHDVKARKSPEKKNFRILYDSDHGILMNLHNLMVTEFKEGFYFDEVPKKKRELFAACGVPVPDVGLAGRAEEYDESLDEDYLNDNEDEQLRSLDGDLI